MPYDSVYCNRCLWFLYLFNSYIIYLFYLYEKINNQKPDS